MPWGLCLTEHHSEARAARELDRIGVRTILAKYRTENPQNAALFPRYLFLDSYEK